MTRSAISTARCASGCLAALCGPACLTRELAGTRYRGRLTRGSRGQLADRATHGRPARCEGIGRPSPGDRPNTDDHPSTSNHQTSTSKPHDDHSTSNDHRSGIITRDDHSSDDHSTSNHSTSNRSISHDQHLTIFRSRSTSEWILNPRSRSTIMISRTSRLIYAYCTCTHAQNQNDIVCPHTSRRKI